VRVCLAVLCDFSPENLDTFVEQLLGGELKPYLKSEPVPTSNEGPVKVHGRPKIFYIYITLLP